MKGNTLFALQKEHDQQYAEAFGDPCGDPTSSPCTSNETSVESKLCPNEGVTVRTPCPPPFRSVRRRRQRGARRVFQRLYSTSVSRRGEDTAATTTSSTPSHGSSRPCSRRPKALFTNRRDAYSIFSPGSPSPSQQRGERICDSETSASVLHAENDACSTELASPNRFYLNAPVPHPPAELPHSSQGTSCTKGTINADRCFEPSSPSPKAYHKGWESTPNRVCEAGYRNDNPSSKEQAPVGGTGAARGHTHTVRMKVLHWIQSAGIDAEPPAMVWRQRHLYSINPLQYHSMWRRLCARSRRLLSQLKTNMSIICGTADTVGLRKSTHQSRSVRRINSVSHGSSREKVGAKPTPMGLREAREQMAYRQWCLFQLDRFYSRGPSYICSVWKGRAGRHFEHILCGRYVVPTEERITNAVDRFRREYKRARWMLRCMYEEVGMEPPCTASLSIDDGYGAGGDEADGDIAVSPAEYGDGGEEPYLEVRMEHHTGLLHASIYVSGGDTGATSEFAATLVAGCVDNCRWLVLEGLWRGHLLFFQPRYQCGEMEAFEDVMGVSVEGKSPPGAPRDGNISEMQALTVCGVWFERNNLDKGCILDSDGFRCSRCGNVRRYANSVYISRMIRELRRGSYYCSYCRRKTIHLRVPEQWEQEVAALRRQLECVEDASVGPRVADYYRVLRLVHLLTACRNKQRPPWSGRTHLDTQAIVVPSAPPGKS